MSLHSLDYVISDVIGPEIPYSRRTLCEHLRPGGRFAGCAHKVGNRWAFTDSDIERLLERMRPDAVDLDEEVAPAPVRTRLPSGMSPNSPRARGAA